MNYFYDDVEMRREQNKGNDTVRQRYHYAEKHRQ